MHAGPLSAVRNLTVLSLASNAISVTWLPPFSLNLTTAEPDVVYCVNVFNEIRDHQINNCSVIETEYSFVPNSEDHVDQYYEVTVTPRSNVEGARNGSSATAMGPPLTGLSICMYSRPCVSVCTSTYYT